MNNFASLALFSLIASFGISAFNCHKDNNNMQLEFHFFNLDNQPMTIGEENEFNEYHENIKQINSPKHTKDYSQSSEYVQPKKRQEIIEWRNEEENTENILSNFRNYLALGLRESLVLGISDDNHLASQDNLERFEISHTLSNAPSSVDENVAKDVEVKQIPRETVLAETETFEKNPSHKKENAPEMQKGKKRLAEGSANTKNSKRQKTDTTQKNGESERRLPKEATAVLSQWLSKNAHPSEETMEELAKETGLKTTQVSYWFNNARRRILPKQVENKALVNTDETYEKESSPQKDNEPKKRKRLPASAVQVLKTWFYENWQAPYPDEEMKEKLAVKSGLRITQVNNWLTNARRRILPQIIEEACIVQQQ